MPTQCSAELFEFAPVDRRAVVAGFDDGTITSNAGALLLGQLGSIYRGAHFEQGPTLPAWICGRCSL